MHSKTHAQLQIIREVRDVLAAHSLRWWLFGGWGLDARIGKVTRDHTDIEFWVAQTDGDSVRDALVASGFTALETQPPEESREFTRHDIAFSSAFFDPGPDQTFRLQGRWSDWVFPAGSFDASPGRLGELIVPAMSIDGMLAMKEQYPTLRNGGLLREKDFRDLEFLRELAVRKESMRRET
jgi:lincosamide nucleotidyltransferase A/C/D/E